MTFEGGGTAMRPVPIGGAVEAFKRGLAARKPVSEHNRQCRGLARYIAEHLAWAGTGGKMP
jgi:hypothetical protein